MGKRYVFDVRLGDAQVMRVVELDATLDSAGVQRVYEGWRDGILTCGWWPEEMDYAVKEMQQGWRESEGGEE